MSKITYRRMTRGDLDYVIDWAAAEGWNPGMNDAELFYRVDPAGYFMAFDGDKPVGAISAVKYGEHFGFIGLFIVVPGLRGGFIGVRLGRLALEYLNGRIIGLDGVMNKIRNYKFAGFELAYFNARYKAAARPFEPAASIIPLAGAGDAEIARFDGRFFPAARPGFITGWANQPGVISFGMLENERLRAMGVARPCRNGYKIGPLVAEDPDLADAVFRALVSDMPEGAEYFLDMPEPNPYALALVRKYRMEKVFATARMYKNGTPTLPLENIYGITTFELG
ncbi:MAG: hypothetical protein PHW69_08555 [Elusimicrobiaceae bacterium]|nr:hypothetical protein [Elusimicrobiaceae bacterium]